METERETKKKRGGVKEKETTTKVNAKATKQKKPVHVVAVVTPDGIEGTFTPEPRRPLIMHLPFQSTEISLSDGFSELHYDPNPPPQPEPYDDPDNQYFQVNTDNSTSENQIGVEQEGWKMMIESNGKENEKEKETDKENDKEILEYNPSVPIITTVVEKEIPKEKKGNFVNVLECYKTKTGEVLKVPEKTNIACFWCSYDFEGSPSFLPVKEEGGIYSTYGNFCCPQCALAYLLDEHIDSNDRWERMSLLHRMYKIQKRLYPAPPRNSLKKFGGVYTYEEYREIIGESKIKVDIHQPPMVSVTSILDTKPIDFYDSSVQNTFTAGFSLDRFKSWSEHGGALRLKRSKPLKDKESTLDAYMNITIKRG
jgi:hypothetical protein